MTKPVMVSASLLAWVAFCSAGAAEKILERVVNGSTITSVRDPTVRIELPRSAQYVGNAQWDLYDIADCELHVFVEADAQNVVRRLYWIQFEPDAPSDTPIHEYNSEAKLIHAWREFKFPARFGPASKPAKPGSDFEHVMALLKKGDFRTPAGLMNVRLVHLLNEATGKKIIFIYGEDLALTGNDVEEASGPEDAWRWLELKAGLLKRAHENIRIEAGP